LSWSPTNQVYDGKLRKIRVVVPGGYQLEYRRAYYAVEPGSTQPQPEKSVAGKKAADDPQVRDLASAMQHGSPSSTQLQFVANVLPHGKPMPETAVERARRKLFETATEASTLKGEVSVQHFAVNVALFGSELTFQPGEDRNAAFRVLFNAAAFDGDGRELAAAQNEVHSTLSAAQLQKTRAGELRDTLEIAAPVDARTIMIGIMDLSSNRIGTLEIPVPTATHAP
jgi:hypothetical protein